MKQELEDLIEAVEAAINAGDWKVDGACDPTSVLIRAKKAIEKAQEPVAWALNFELFWPSEYEVISKDDDKAIPLYTSPPQRQPLTDEELKKTWYDMKNIMGWYSFQEIARAIEQAHGIKGDL